MEWTALQPGQESAIREMSQLATEIVREHFDPLIGKAQNDYMLRRFQTPEAIAEQLRQGYRYYFARVDGQNVGFTAFYPRDGKMYLSKFYLRSDCRGRGYARAMFEFVRSETQKEGLPAIFLNVNRDNAEPIAVYHHLGFKLHHREKNDIGNGFFMDDEVLQYELSPLEGANEA